jgi:hypothetical protein
VQFVDDRVLVPTELRTFLEGELRRLEAQNAAGTRELGARIDQLERSLKPVRQS